MKNKIEYLIVIGLIITLLGCGTWGNANALLTFQGGKLTTKVQNVIPKEIKIGEEKNENF